jgi:myo-inositol-1(or 4)-monophosphatase
MGNNRKALIQRFSNCLTAARGIRRLGSAALDLCFVACGRFDGFWEENLNPWDTAAGMLIAREAGGVSERRAKDARAGTMRAGPGRSRAAAPNGRHR